MSLLALTLVAQLVVSTDPADNVLGTYRRGDANVEIYRGIGSCGPGERGGARTPPDAVFPYVMGCWRQGPGGTIVIRFTDGLVWTLPKSGFTPGRHPPAKFNL